MKEAAALAAASGALGEEEELMWLAGPSTDASDEWAAELELGAGGWHQDRAVAEDPRDSGSEPRLALPPDDVEERLGAVAAEEGWDEDEVQAIRAYLSGVEPPRPEPEPEPGPEPESPSRPWSEPHRAPMIPSEFDLPGAEELDEAMAALGRPAPQPLYEPADSAAQPAGPGAEPDPPTAPPEGSAVRAWSKSNDPEQLGDAADQRDAIEWPGLDQEYRAAPSLPDAPAAPSAGADAAAPPATPPTGSEPEPEWLRGRQDAAARAYRRLRRIFPNQER